MHSLTTLLFSLSACQTKAVNKQPQACGHWVHPLTLKVSLVHQFSIVIVVMVSNKVLCLCSCSVCSYDVRSYCLNVGWRILLRGPFCLAYVHLSTRTSSIKPTLCSFCTILYVGPFWEASGTRWTTITRLRTEEYILRFFCFVKI
jgi:hypothetical protein